MSILIYLSFSSYAGENSFPVIKVVIFILALFTALYIGGRGVEIGVDTIRYESAFYFYKNLENFEIRKDVFYDFLSFAFSKAFSFQQWLTFCAFLYVFGAYIGLKKIFNNNFYLAFLIFLISPYFFGNGISGIRSGMAASIFLIGLGLLYKNGLNWKVICWFIISVLFHISMIIPLLFFILATFVKNTKIIFICWLCSILIGILNLNVIANIVSALGVFESRIGNYAVNEGERNFWTNFVIFGFFPVVFAVYNILVLNYRHKFYTWFVNGYMLIHIPYIMLLNSQYGLRLGYLAEFMMSIILLFPLMIDPIIKIKYIRFKLSLLIICLFLIKAYKVLII